MVHERSDSKNGHLNDGGFSSELGTTILTCVFEFEAAHFLPNAPPGHKCRRVHGHNYRVSLHVAGPVDPGTGWIMDFSDVGELWAPVAATIDHQLLNDIVGLENPTAERLASWIWERLECPEAIGDQAVSVVGVEVAETGNACALFVAPGVAPWIPGHLTVSAATSDSQAQNLGPMASGELPVSNGFKWSGEEDG